MREEMYAHTHEPAHFVILSSFLHRGCPFKDTGRMRWRRRGAQHSVDSRMHY
jgi:hypothetical protein